MVLVVTVVVSEDTVVDTESAAVSEDTAQAKEVTEVVTVPLLLLQFL